MNYHHTQTIESMASIMETAFYYQIKAGLTFESGNIYASSYEEALEKFDEILSYYKGRRIDSAILHDKAGTIINKQWNYGALICCAVISIAIWIIAFYFFDLLFCK